SHDCRTGVVASLLYTHRTATRERIKSSALNTWKRQVTASRAIPARWFPRAPAAFSTGRDQRNQIVDQRPNLSHKYDFCEPGHMAECSTRPRCAVTGRE